MCGIIGISAKRPVAADLYDGLLALQHRGQDAAGIATYDGQFHSFKGEGLVQDVFTEENMQNLPGFIGIAHNRYPTAGCSASDAYKIQPFFVNSPYGIALAHNGNVYNYDELKNNLFEKSLRYLESDSDSELILNIFAYHLQQEGGMDLKPEQIFGAVKQVFDVAKGSYSVITLIAGQGLVGFRDPYGIRPLILGKKKHPKTLSDEYILASEDVPLSILDFEVMRDIAPGEVIYIDNENRVHSKVVANKRHIPCIFEYVYLARPDSTLDRISVNKARLRMGEKLYEKIKKLDVNDADVVIPVPDSSRTAAITLAYLLGIKYREGLIKNRYIGRTFIMPGQALRQKSIKRKLNPIPLEFKDKNVILVDDSIVRGNTAKKIVQMVRDAGAKKVYFAVCAPPLKFPCLYGVDMPTKKELIADQLSFADMEKELKIDRLIYQDLDDLIEACNEYISDIKEFCTACFDGNYKTPGVTADILKNIAETRRGDEPEEDKRQMSLI